MLYVTCGKHAKHRFKPYKRDVETDQNMWKKNRPTHVEQMPKHVEKQANICGKLAKTCGTTCQNMWKNLPKTRGKHVEKLTKTCGRTDKNMWKN